MQFSVFTGAALGYMLMKMKKLQHLDISGNKICDDDKMSSIAWSLGQIDTLTKLILANCEISVRGT